ncbi:CusA/CzcA family heavy metal efflux RND transporter [Flavihumibacter rivuli]|uniref:CusA/CzcA family heavy metal efflux RND transporter n=1 Tax=Flavihumibacter rivuli TaxID=2838156 RepID=UPI001BDDCAF9|nr:CusA/CzcA family heavy metal efflux RND transporter [Flavihumibacter rivuli]ULQ57052.1 CusA/CzcA family heavy metal efflux RND transporter [Flavihumibacter rivuli]
MLNKIIRFSIQNKLIIGLLVFALIGWGAYSVSRLPIDALPDITSNQVQVITVSPTLAAPEVERLITFPIEQASANIPGLTEMRSISRFGLSVVTVVFNDETDIYWARQQMAERMIQVKDQIPPDAGLPSLAPPTTGLGEIYQYVVRPKPGYEQQYDLTELRSIQDWIIRRQLLGTPGVADVSSFGGNLKQYEVAVNPDRLKSMNTTVAEVFAALEQNNQNSGGSYIEKNANALFIRTEGLATNISDIASIFIKHTAGGIPVYLRDVAEVRIGKAVRYGAMVYKDQGEVAGAVVLMLKGANASQVVKAVKQKMEAIKKTLPEGVTVEPFYDRTKMVTNAIETVKKNLLEGALIVVFVLVLFLGNLRAGLIVASVIPLAMLFAVSMMRVFGVSGNLMSLGALDFGLIVDGAVIIVEAVMHKLYHSKGYAKVTRIDQAKMNGEVEEASSKMMNAAVFGQIIILIVYLPILSLVGIEGKMFKPMAQTVSFALIGAFLLSLTYVPMITSLVLSKKISHKESWADKMMNAIQAAYSPLLKKVLAFPKTIVVVALVLFAVAVWLASRLGGEFIPELEEGDFAVDTRVLTGSSLTTSIKVSQQGAGILLKRFPEIEKIVTRIGAGEIPTDPMPIEMGDMIILLKDKSEWTSAKSYDELANKMSEALSEVPGVTAGFQFPVQMRFNELISGARQDVVCKIFGEDLDALASYAHQLGGLIRQVEGAKDIYVEPVTGLPQVVIRYNREAMARYRLSISEVNRLVRAAFAGESAGLIYENERRYDLVVRLSDLNRQNISDIRQLLVPTGIGTQVPLYQVAEISLKEGPNQIQREDAKRRIVVGFNVRGRDVETVVGELQKLVNKKLSLPAGYYIHYGGQFQNLQEAKQRLSIAVPVALLLIFLMLYFSFGSIKYGILIFSAIPLSAIGGIMLLNFREMPFSISAGVGFIALFGVAVLNGIVLITEFNRLKKQGMTDIKQVVMEGTALRLRPVLMTAAVASLGFLPMALSHGPGAEVQRPLATVVIGGLVTATFLTLVVLPVLYVWVEQWQARTSKNVIAATLIFLLAGYTANAQTKTSDRLPLDSMLSIAERQNLGLQASRKAADFYKQLGSGVFELNKTQVGVEYGNINSFNNDNRFFISQGFSLPAIYNRQKDLYAAQRQSQLALSEIQANDIRRMIKQAFYQLVELDERERLLLQLDSVYGRFREAAALRLQAGETNQLEKTTADAQVGQLQLQLDQLRADRIIVQQQLSLLLNSGNAYLPLYQQPIKPFEAVQGAGASNPLIRYQQQQAAIARAEGAVEKARLNPDFGLGYSNQSIIGYQSKDGVTQDYFSGSDRFHIVNFSVALPLFMKATRNRVKAAEISASVAELNANAALQQLQYRQNQLMEDHAKYSKQVSYFTSTGNEQSGQLMRQAREAFQKGEIDYLQWVQLMNQSVQIRLNYLEAVRMLNQTTIEIEYINGK